MIPKEKINVEIKLHSAGGMLAFADVSLFTDLGEITLNGFKVCENNTDKGLWVAMPSQSFSKSDGSKGFKKTVLLSKTLMGAVIEAVMLAYQAKAATK